MLSFFGIIPFYMFALSAFYSILFYVYNKNDDIKKRKYLRYYVVSIIGLTLFVIISII